MDKQTKNTFMGQYFIIKLLENKWTLFQGQGQTNQRVGLYLLEPVFAHGQLYTGFSRGCRKKDVCVYIGSNSEGFTENVVYPELLM